MRSRTILTASTALLSGLLASACYHQKDRVSPALSGTSGTSGIADESASATAIMTIGADMMSGSGLTTAIDLATSIDPSGHLTGDTTSWTSSVTTQSSVGSTQTSTASTSTDDSVDSDDSDETDGTDDSDETEDSDETDASDDSSGSNDASDDSDETDDSDDSSGSNDASEDSAATDDATDASGSSDDESETSGDEGPDPCDDDPCHIVDGHGKSCVDDGWEGYVCQCHGDFTAQSDCESCPDGQIPAGGHACTDEVGPCDGVDCGTAATCTLPSGTCACVDPDHVMDGSGDCSDPCDGTCANEGVCEDGVCTSCPHGHTTASNCEDCPDGQHDENGTCVPDCPSCMNGSEARCNADGQLETCVDACWVASECDDARVCDAGSCECADGRVECDGECIDPETDEDHCGVSANCSGGTSCQRSDACVSGTCLPERCDGELEFDDPDVETEIRSVVSIPDRPLTFEDLRSVTELEFEGGRVGDLGGLECVINLERLNCVGFEGADQVSDLSPLSELTKLSYLRLTSNQIRDLSPLRGLVNMKTAYLASNPITSLDGMETWSELAFLHANTTNLVDIDALAGKHKLRLLQIRGVPSLRDISPLAGLSTLEDLMLRDSGIEDLTPLTTTPALTWASVEGCPVDCGDQEDVIDAINDILVNDNGGSPLAVDCPAPRSVQDSVR